MTLKNKQFLTNASQSNPRVMVQCRTQVKRDAVRRESIDGVEHIIVSSSTLPDNIVMNGGMYPADEIEKSFKSLELTLAPVEHPQVNGQYISANDPRAIHGFHAGAFNMNVRRENGRVHVDKYINVAEAKKSEKGKRLLDRIDELETNNNPRPIHTSVGVFVSVEELPEMMTNDAGDQYKWIARDMVFDHDAILLDNVGAAQPHQGVGVAVNRNGDELKVDSVEILQSEVNSPSARTPINQEDIVSKFNSIINNANLSFRDIERNLREELEKQQAVNKDDWLWVVDVFPNTKTVIYEIREDLFAVPFDITDNGQITIVNVPVAVERNVTFTPKTNHSDEGDTMRELMLKALADAGITVNAEISDSDLLAQYNELQTKQASSGGEGEGNDTATVVANAVATALAPVTEKLNGLEQKLNSADQAEIDRLADLVGNSDKYPGIDAETAKTLPLGKLKEMATNCTPAFGLSPVINAGSDNPLSAPAEMPS